ncbi:MAG: hypothetical protein E6J91_13575 [Deltaproteobacteria bacterium]|nr:MAG: hypothetical protein E6J91_13575 [Deltaproteobacteria bacterium]
MNRIPSTATAIAAEAASFHPRRFTMAAGLCLSIGALVGVAAALGLDGVKKPDVLWTPIVGPDLELGPGVGQGGVALDGTTLIVSIPTTATSCAGTSTSSSCSARRSRAASASTAATVCRRCRDRST